MTLTRQKGCESDLMVDLALCGARGNPCSPTSLCELGVCAVCPYNVLDKTDYPSGNGATSIATGDFNGDGKLDLATSNGKTSTTSVLLNGACLP